MTPQEKAERYDKLTKEVKDFFEGKQKMPNDVDKTLELLFPELKESEDERIRKGLIKAFGSIGKKEWGGINVKNAIAWLEKQGDKDELIKELGEYKAKYTQEVLGKHLRTMSKDDERLRKTTIAFLKDFAEQGYENAVECIDWLEKQGEKKPQGKSLFEVMNEEKVDNQFCVKPVNETSIAVNNPDAYKIGFADGEAHAKEEQWKPSDAQMEVLKEIIADEHTLDAFKEILKGLQEQLKKLREE